MKWADDTDWGKLFTEGGEINETCTYSSSSLCRRLLSTLSSDWRKSALPSLEREIANWKGLRMVDELCQRLTHRYAEFMVLLNEFLPEYSELNPVHPPRTHWRNPEALFELLRRDDAHAPVTRDFLVEHKNVILDVVTEYNCNLRADMIQMVFADPFGPTKPIAITEEKALETLNRASTLFVKKDRFTGARTSTLYTYEGLIGDIRKDFRYDELNIRLRYEGYDPYGWSGVLLEMLGLDDDVTWSVVDANQEEKPLICLCGKPGFKQPASFVDLVSCCYAPRIWDSGTDYRLIAFAHFGGMRLAH